MTKQTTIEQLKKQHAMEIAGIESNMMQQKTYILGELAQEVEKLKFNVDSSSIVIKSHDKAIDLVLQLIRERGNRE